MNMPTELNIDQTSRTFSECLKEVNNLGYTTYHNICDGAESVIVWGSGDWVVFSLLFAGAVFILILLASFIWMVLKDNIY